MLKLVVVEIVLKKKIIKNNLKFREFTYEEIKKKNNNLSNFKIKAEKYLKKIKFIFIEEDNSTKIRLVFFFSTKKIFYFWSRI